MTEPHPVDVALHFVECINRQDLEGLAALMPDDHRFIDLAGDVEVGGETMCAGWASYFALCPEYMIHVCEISAIGDNVLIVGRTTGSHVRQPRHIEIQDTVIWVARIRGDSVAGWELYHDTPDQRAALRSALGEPD